MANVNGFNPLSPIEMPSALQKKGTEGGLLVFAGLLFGRCCLWGLSCDVVLSAAIARHNSDIVCIHALKEEHYAHHHP